MAKTGDVILFSRFNFGGMIMDMAMDSTWHHSGIIVWMEDGKITESSGEMMILESLMARRDDVVTGKVVKGLALNKADVSRKYYSRASFIRLKDRTGICQALETFHAKHVGENVKYGNISHLQIWLQIPGKRDDSRFCSELVVDFFREFFNDDSFPRPGPSELIYPELLSGILNHPRFETELNVLYRDEISLMRVAIPVFMLILLIIGLSVLAWYVISLVDSIDLSRWQGRGKPWSSLRQVLFVKF